MISKLFRRNSLPKVRHGIPKDKRVFAIGDVHGRSDLLSCLLDKIYYQCRERPLTDTHIIFLGDLIDRGPDSRGVLESILNMNPDLAKVHLIKGNHEEIFLTMLDGDTRSARVFCNIGGRETLASYGIDKNLFDEGGLDVLCQRAAASVPAEHKRLLDTGLDMLTIGDYLFTHAGTRPGVPISEQKPQDLRWIRSEFLDYEGTFEKVVVHGHSIAVEVEERPHRIGIDTGAYRSGILTALGLEGTNRWFIQASDADCQKSLHEAPFGRYRATAAGA